MGRRGMVWVMGLLLACLGTSATADDAPRTMQELMATYGWITDRHDLEGMLALFEEDATLESPKTKTIVHGREAIGMLLSAAWAKQPADERKRRHLITGVRALGTEGDEVRFTASLGVVGTTDAGLTKLYATGFYEGVAQMSDDGLRFRFLRISID